jgi:hypothetical protein
MGGKNSGRPGGTPENLTNKGKGRKKGSKNKFGGDIKAMVIAAIDSKGGQEFFKELDPKDLARLAGKLIPQVVDATVNGNITVEIIKSGDGKHKN